MTDQRDRISDLFHAALTRAPEERIPFLRQACGSDHALREELESLLRQDATAAGFLDHTAADVLREVVATPGSMLGRRLGPYELLGLIGAGGMGEVYKGRDTRLNRTVAIKILPARHRDDPDRQRRFEREARAAAALGHPHICVLHDIGQHEQTRFLVMEYLEGETLASRLQKSALPIDQVLRYGSEMADALTAAHRAGIVHRDLKPENVMLTKSGVKLLDFGLAKLRPLVVSDAGAAPTVTVSDTADGRILGTLAYMAPEQLEGGDADGRSDLFALGAIVYEMASGRRAFSGNSQASLIASILDRDPEPLANVQPAAPLGLDRLVRRCLAKDPDARWQSAADVADELRWIGQISTLARTFRLWIRRTAHPDSPALNTVAFDYFACTYVSGGEQCAFAKPNLHNFARLRVQTLNTTTRCSGGGSDGEQFKTILGRARARSASGYLSTRAQITKLYALESTNFYDALGSCPTSNTGNSTYDVLGIFTVDPLSVVKVLDRIAKDNSLDGEWVEVPFPVAYMIFDEMP